jgi:hypothetical protein|tara:strand:- start:1831 stop:1989 length:159 start_codon:yes stop_codon:yes gene_type:complete
MSTLNPAPYTFPPNTKLTDKVVQDYFLRQQETVRLLSQDAENAKRYALMMGR